MKLFEIDEAIRNFDLEVDEETGEVLNYDELEKLNLARDKKVEGIGLWIKELTAEKEAIKKEREGFAYREKVLGNKIDSLKNYLAYALGGEKFSTPRLVVSYRRSESVNIVDEMKVPDEYCHFSVDRKPDKTLLKKMLKQGKEIDGVTLTEKSNIQVK